MAQEPDKSKKDETRDVAKRTAEEIITQHVIFAMVAGAIPIPVVDVVAVSAIQFDMLSQLAAKFGVDYNQERGKALASAIVGSTLGSVVGRAGASALKVVPGIGTALGVGSQVVVSGATTYALGKVFEAHFQENGTLVDIDLESMKQKFQDMLAKGREVIEKMKAKPDKQEILATIERLAALKESGAISDKEFQKAKEQLLARLTA